MRSIWSLRAFRLWLVLIAPALLFAGFHFLSATANVATFEHEVSTWEASETFRAAKGERLPLTDYDRQAFRLRYDFSWENKRRVAFGAAILLGISIPAVAMLFTLIARWIWASPRTLDGQDDRSFDDITLAKYRNAYAWFSIVVAAISIHLLLFPVSGLKLLIATLVQALGVACIAWVVLRFKAVRRSETNDASQVSRAK